jgi:hypothetical protein
MKGRAKLAGWNKKMGTDRKSRLVCLYRVSFLLLFPFFLLFFSFFFFFFLRVRGFDEDQEWQPQLWGEQGWMFPSRMTNLGDGGFRGV